MIWVVRGDEVRKYLFERFESCFSAQPQDILLNSLLYILKAENPMDWIKWIND